MSRMLNAFVQALRQENKRGMGDPYTKLPLRAPRPAPVGTKTERREVRLEERRKVYKSLPAKPAGASRVAAPSMIDDEPDSRTPKQRRRAAQKGRRHLPEVRQRRKLTKAIFLPVFGKTIHDRNMGSKAVRVGGLSSHAPSTHSKARKHPAKAQRRRQRIRRIERRERSLADLLVGQAMCEEGDHELGNVTIEHPDGTRTRRCVRYKCGHVEKVRKR